MANRTLLSSLSRGVLRPCAFCVRNPRLACFLLICVVFLLNAVSAIAQTSQRVYASVPAGTTTTSLVVSFTKDSTGALSPVGTAVGSALEGGPMTLDGKGQFLFVLNPTSGQISMYQIGQTLGLTEVPSSPFSANTGGVGPNSATPVCVAADKSGHFLYVGFEPANPSANGEIVEYAIDATAQQILMNGSIQTPPGLIDCVTNQQNFLYVGLKGGGANVYTIGQLQAAPANAGSGKAEVSIAVDPQGHFFFDGWGGSTGFVESAPISPADGSATGVTAPFSLGANNSPSSMLVDGRGKFLYVTESGSVYGYAIDAGTGVLGVTSGQVLQTPFVRATSAADPQGPFIYSLHVDGIHVFEIGPDGALAEGPGSPFSTGSSGARGLAISGTPVQAVTGAVAQLFPPAQDFGSINVGQTAGPKPLTVTNTGSLPFTVTGVVVSGADAGDFVAPSTCAPQPFLPPNAGMNSTCSVGVSFTPTGTGPRQATLTITTDAAAAQSAQLTGSATAAQAGVTMAPDSLAFPSTVQGATSAPQSVTLTSSGAAALHISSVLLTGANANDFAMSNGCSGAYPANASCTIAVTLSPLGDGARTASITIADDAPGSPQMVPLSGTGTGAPVPRPAATITPPAAVFAAIPLGTTSQVQNVAITNSGGAALHIASVLMSGANSGDFSFNNGCTAAAYAVNTAWVIGITFTPTAIGNRTAMLTITDDVPNSPQTVPVSGSGAGAPSVNLSPDAVSFAATALGTTSPRQNITVTNMGAAALHFSSIKLGAPTRATLV
jgi:6-phosphogluconolactonase (cycloisomerase 2 family)